MKKTILLFQLLALLILTQATYGQSVAINNDGSSANASAILDVKSTSKGMLIPRMTQAQRNAISSPATGLMIYQTDGTAGFYYYNGSSWTSLSGGGSSGATLDLLVTKTSSQSLSTGGTSVTPDDVIYNNVVTSPSLSGASYNNSTGVYTVGVSGTYLVTATLVGTGASFQIVVPQLMVNGSDLAYGSSVYNTNFSTGTNSRGILSIVVTLAANDQVKIKGANSSTSATAPLSTNGTSRLSIVKL